MSKSSSTPGPVVLLGAADGLLLDDMLRLAAAAHVEPVLAHDVSSIQRWWSQADLIVVGADLARALVRPPVRRDRVLLVDRYDDRAALNETAVALGAEHVVVLPDDQAWLVDQVAAAGEGRPTGVVLPVVGCRGGAGASTLVAALARQAVDVGLSCVVVDADPTGADLDVLLDMADEPGLRWPDLVVSGGRLPAEPLAAALPRRAGVAVLCAGMPADVPLLAGTRASQGSSGAPAPSSWLPDGGLAPAVDALARAFDLVVLDVPRWLPGSAGTRWRPVTCCSSLRPPTCVASPRLAACAQSSHPAPARPDWWCARLGPESTRRTSPTSSRRRSRRHFGTIGASLATGLAVSWSCGPVCAAPPAACWPP